MAAQDAGLMLIKTVARNLWRDDEPKRYTTWYEPLDEQRAVDAAVAFALARREAAGICAPSDVRLLPMMIEAERRRDSTTTEDAAAELALIPDVEPPFLRIPGRVVPEWLEPLIQER